MSQLTWCWDRLQAAGPRLYRGSVILALGMCLAHVLSLPIAITYDGHLYLDMADVIGSSRFPRDWLPARTPLFPLALKLSFELFGRQALAAILVASVAGLAAVLVAGNLASRLSGKLGGAAVVALLAFDPLLASYGHYVLTETGTAAFIAAIVSLCLWYPACGRGQWAKALLLSMVLAAGYYWRQNVMYLAPAAAVLHGLGGWVGLKGSPTALGVGWLARGRLYGPLLTQMLLMTLGVYAATLPFNRYLRAEGFRDVMLRFGMVKQALAPPEDPWIGEDAALYKAVIEQSQYRGHFFGGIRGTLHRDLANKLAAKPQVRKPAPYFLHLIKTYPDRYLCGVTRTFLNLAGAPGAEDENRAWRATMLSGNPASRIAEGPARLDALIREQFLQRTQPSLVQHLFRRLSGVYDVLLPAAFFMLVAGLVASLVLRHLALFTFCALPLAYLVPYVLLLISVDRYAFPVYPVVLSGLVVVPAMVARRCRSQTP